MAFNAIRTARSGFALENMGSEEMQELKAPDRKEEEVAPISAPLGNLPRLPMNVGWLRPVAAAGPVAAKLILEQVERVAATAPVRTLPATLAGARQFS